MAALLLQQTDGDLQGANQCGVIAACATGTISVDSIESLLVQSGTPGSVEQTISIPAASSRLGIFMQSGDDVPGAATWDAGDWIVRFNITTAQASITLESIWICRIDNACGAVASIASETGIGLDVSAGGVFMRTLAALEHTNLDTDEIYIVVEFANAHDHTARSVGIVPDQIIDTPILVGTIIAIGQALEADSPLAVVPREVHPFGLALETNVAQVMRQPVDVAIGLASETGAAFPMQPERVHLLGAEGVWDDDNQVWDDDSSVWDAPPIPTEISTVFSITPSFQQFVSMGLASEADAAIAVTPDTGALVVPIGLVLETDVAQVVAAARDVTIGLATEIATAFTIARSKAQTLGLAAETDASFVIAPLRIHTIGLAPETDLAQALIAARSVALGLSAEVDAAVAVTSSRAHTLGLVSEIDASFVVVPLRTHVLGLTAEFDVAQLFGVARSQPIGLAPETDSAFLVSSGTEKVVALGQVLEADVAQVIAALRTHTIGLVTSVDAAFAMGVARAVSTGLSLEADVARSVGVDRSILLGLSSEADAVLGAQPSRTTPLGLATELDAALALSQGVATVVSVGLAAELDAARTITSALLFPDWREQDTVSDGWTAEGAAAGSWTPEGAASGGWTEEPAP